MTCGPGGVPRCFSSAVRWPALKVDGMSSSKHTKGIWFHSNRSPMDAKSLIALVNCWDCVRRSWWPVFFDAKLTALSDYLIPRSLELGNKKSTNLSCKNDCTFDLQKFGRSPTSSRSPMAGEAAQTCGLFAILLACFAVEG